ncbi:hypothetical protein BU23DRAFT_568044 [Bimuria novae-zelandiae CBS 107.79]|uniref:Uncharacterized protein n=1 Tax=Bimuria novae-zelandiae CBS 107.79 TaxID=1447943 RepID=A0A6A5V8W1_9PLEO|nr:hypothetical protein BU23DRAFT_568044 [Bimuria novae-zelandiae CBS 107.79]
MPMPTLFKWSPRPEQTPDGSPASQSSSRFGTLHSNVRSIINGSSIYSRSPNLGGDSSPKTPFMGFFRRDHPPAPIDMDAANGPRNSDDSRSPLHPQHTARSYMRSIAPLQDPQEPQTVYRRDSDVPDRHPADVHLDYGRGVDLETEVLSDEVQQRRRRRHHRRRKHHRNQRAWVRRRGSKRGCMPFVRGSAARGKLVASIISGLFLTTVLAIYLALALSKNALSQEIHVLFIMIVLGTTIFFCHSLIRLCILILRPPREDPERPSIPNMTGPEGFHPVRPIRVHLARDEELADAYTSDEEDAVEGAGLDADGGEKDVKLPPPAYGLWRSSVKVDPNLLHWQRVDDTLPPPAAPFGVHPGSRSGSVSSARTRNGSVVSMRNGSVSSARGAPVEQGPRPPSYASDDGVSYVVEARARSVAPSHTGVSDIHPAWRPGYAVSEVSMEWPPR